MLELSFLLNSCSCFLEFFFLYSFSLFDCSEFHTTYFEHITSTLPRFTSHPYPSNFLLSSRLICVAQISLVVQPSTEVQWIYRGYTLRENSLSLSLQLTIAICSMGLCTSSPVLSFISNLSIIMFTKATYLKKHLFFSFVGLL